MTMDPLIVKSIKSLFVELHRKGDMPKNDFTVTELEGRLALSLGKDVGTKPLVATLGAIGVKRNKDGRSYANRTFRREVNNLVAEATQEKDQGS